MKASRKLAVRLKPKQCKETQVTIGRFSCLLFSQCFSRKANAYKKTNGLFHQARRTVRLFPAAFTIT